jgi:hypothetical protein
MNSEFEFIKFHISHLAQFGMIYIILKSQKKKTYVKKFIVFSIIRHGFWLLSSYSHPNGLGKLFKWQIFNTNLSKGLEKKIQKYSPKIIT